MTNDTHEPRDRDVGADPIRYRAAVAGVLIAGAACGLGQTIATDPQTPAAVWTAGAAAIGGVIGMLVAGYAVSRRPKDSPTLALAALTSLLGALATNAAWDAIRLMQWVMAGTALAAAVIVLLPPTAQRVAFSLMVLYHFAGVCSAITSPPPTPWMTGQLWARLFRPHLEFSYVNNAYQFYSPQPGPAQILWFCITGEDGESRWYKMPRRSEMLDPLGIEYFRRLSLTERANQNVVVPSEESKRYRGAISQDIPFHPESLPLQQYRAPNEHAKHILAGYGRHVATVLGTGRTDEQGRPVPVRTVKVYLTMHQMLSQLEFQRNKDPYAPETYVPFFVGEFDAAGRPVLNDFNKQTMYWLIPIYRTPSVGGQPGTLKNFVSSHATDLQGECDPFDPAMEWGENRTRR